jgi:hypothetical protein
MMTKKKGSAEKARTPDRVAGYRRYDKGGRFFFRQRSVRSSIFATPTHITLSAPPQ